MLPIRSRLLWFWSLENVWERNQIFTSCLLQPAAHDMLKLANFGKVEFLRHIYKYPYGRKENTATDFSCTKRIKANKTTAKTDQTTWERLRYTIFPLANIYTSLHQVYIAYVYILYSYIVYVFLFHNFDQTRGISDWDHCKQSLTKLGGFLIETTVNNLKSLILNTRILL